MAAEREAIRDGLDGRREEGARALVARADAAASPDEPADLSELVARAQAGDAAAREELIERFLPYVSSLARGYRAAGLEHMDLVQEGCAGLLRALHRYDAARGVPFAAYATWWIRHALQEARSDFVRPLRLPPKALQQLARLKSEHRQIYAAEHRDASARELAERTEIDPGQVEALLAADRPARSPRSRSRARRGASARSATCSSTRSPPTRTRRCSTRSPATSCARSSAASPSASGRSCMRASASTGPPRSSSTSATAWA